MDMKVILKGLPIDPARLVLVDAGVWLLAIAVAAKASLVIVPFPLVLIKNPEGLAR